MGVKRQILFFSTLANFSNFQDDRKAMGFRGTSFLLNRRESRNLFRNSVGRGKRADFVKRVRGGLYKFLVEVNLFAVRDRKSKLDIN